MNFANGIPLALQDLLSEPDAAPEGRTQKPAPAAAKPKEAVLRIGAAPSKLDRLDKANAEILGKSDLFDWTPAAAAHAPPKFRQAPAPPASSKSGVVLHKKTAARPEWRDDF